MPAKNKSHPDSIRRPPVRRTRGVLQPTATLSTVPTKN